MGKKKTVLTPGLEKIQLALAEAFGKIEVPLKEQLKKAYRADALRRFELLMEATKSEFAKGRIGEYGTPFYGWYNFSKYDREACQKEWRAAHPNPTSEDYKTFPGDHPSTWEDLKGAWGKHMSVDYYHADRDAAESYDNAKTSFISKNVAKFGNVLGALDVADVKHDFSFTQGCFQGTLAVELIDGGKIRAEISLKYVIRTIPRVTPYYQYPLNFTGANVKGKQLARPSEEELKEILAGI